MSHPPQILAPLSDEELAERFEKIKPLLNPKEAVIEASRCLFCHDAPCVQACPSSIDIPMFIRQIMTKNTAGSAKTIFTQNILGKSCGDVCPTQVLCEGSCVYHDLNDKPIDIGRLQAYATHHALENNWRFFEAGASNGKKVAVIGGGPAGLACAHELRVQGFDVTVFEASPALGGLNRYGVAPYKFNNADATKEVAYVTQIGFDVKTNTPVTQERLATIEAEFDAVFLGVGLGKSQSVGIPGETLEGVIGAAEFIYALREADQKIPLGKRVIVIGGGNTAIDAAVESAKLGAEVTMVYRRSREDMSAYDFEIAHALESGVRLLTLSSPVEILGEDGKARALKCVRNEATASADGKSVITPIAGSEFKIPADGIILATGQAKRESFLQSISGLTLERGKVVVNEHYQTTNPKYFAGGDAVNGGKEVVNAVAHGRDAARGIAHYLLGSGKGEAARV